MTGRKCSTCTHYEPAPIWRKGWCRNPRLYTPQQNHIVNEDDLDCERGMGNYWEAADAGTLASRSGMYEQPVAAPLHLMARAPWQAPVSRQSGQPIYPVSGSSGYPPEPPDDEPPLDNTGGAAPPGRERQLDYYDDDRYWTDYLRIAAPILGVLLLLVLFWFWASSFFGDDEAGNGAPADATGTLGIITAASPTATSPGGVPGTPGIVQTTAPTTPGGATTNPLATSTPAAPDAGAIAEGAMVQVADAGPEGLNMRGAPTTDADIIAVLPDGTELTVTGEPVDAEGYTWWPVTSEAGDGWVVQDFIEPVQ